MTGFDVEYTMTAANVAYMSEQRSLIYFQNSGTPESNVTSGTGLSEGTFSYARTNIGIANAYYAGGTNLIFEMRAWRTWGSVAPNDGCGTYYNKVNNNSWKITVNYQQAPSCIPPQNVVLTNLNDTEAEVSWTEIGTATTWDIEYGLEGFTQGTGTTVNTTSNPYLITGLTELTEYDVYVRSDCGGGDLSAWSGPLNFQTSADCSNYTLEITSSTGGTVVCKGSTTLSAQSSGTGSDIYWYDASFAGNLLGTGPTFTTPIITTTTSYWATEVLTTGATYSGQAKLAPTGSAATSAFTYGLLFTATQNFTLVDVEVFSAGAGGSMVVELQTASGTMLETTTVNVPGGGTTTNPVPFTVPLNYVIVPGDYRLVAISGPNMIRDLSPNAFPFPLGTAGQVTAGYIGGSSQTYYYFYNWTVSQGDVLCESPRVAVDATVTQDGDIIVPPALPYIDANNNTSNYGNTFTGAAGTACGTNENYLNGNDVVYMYTPTMDDVIDIRLKDLTGFYAGLFVYESCGNIGTNCIAGVVAGPSTNDISIEEFTVLAGETYYIVVSSWLTSSIGYTLEINGFVCADFPAPVGDANQNYAAPAYISDLVVSGTMGASVLTWYEDAAGTIIITDPTTFLLVDGTTYYVSQTFGTCESPLLAITVHEIDCSNLEIINTVDGMVVCSGSMTLTATASGSGDEIYWYDVPTGGVPIAIGPTYTTPVLTTSRSYWAVEVYLEQSSGSVGPLPTYCTSFGFGSGCSVGDDIDDFVITDSSGNTILSHLGSGCSPNAYGDFTNNPSLSFTLVAGQTYNFTATHNFSGQWLKIWIDFDKDGVFNNTNELIFVSPAGANPTVGSFTIPNDAIGNTTVMRVFDRWSALPTDSCTSGGSWGEVHDYRVTVIGSSVLCESPREEIFATVSQTGDIVVGPLPYTDTNNTVPYGNTFSGSTGCAGVNGNYLNGNDVVYQYSPVNDDIIIIELTGVGSNAGVFVYESCGDVGGACLAGRVGNGKIEDFYVTGGQDYFIVIGSQSGSTSYTLDIYGFVCSNLAAPTGDSPQIFVTGTTLEDLVVVSDVNSTGLTWYDNSMGTPPALSPTTLLTDGTTYWVSQTVLGCESPLLPITVNELDCNVLGIIGTEGGIVCQQGQVTLTATSSGTGNDIYWYDSQTGGNIVGLGAQLNVFVSSTTDFWAAEVYTESGSTAGGGNQTYCIPTFSSGCAGFGDDINDFVMSGAGINHIGSGCSPSSYGNFRNNPALTGFMVAGQTYNFYATHNEPNHFVKIWIDFNDNGSFEDPGELMFTSSVSSSGNPSTTTGSITIPPTTIGGTFTMRVITKYGSVSTNSCTTGGTWGETHDYTVVITGASVTCASPRVAATAVVNTNIPASPTGAPTQNFCGTNNTVGNIVVTGTDIKWYNAQGSSISNSTVLVNGATYYATQTVNTCESAPFEVFVTILDRSDKPIGDRNQPYVQGETLADLDVTGVDLKWYSDPLGNNPLPETTLLVDQTTYFVTQTLSDLCESETLDIKVHRVLAVDDIAFVNLQFYPNPANDYVTITNTGVIESVEVMSLLGQRVLHQRVDGLTSTIDVTELASGPYLLAVKIDGKTGIYKLIKK